MNGSIVGLKNNDYLEYKYKKQEYLLRIDFETVSSMRSEKVINKYKKFYVDKMDSLYKGLLKNYSVKIADNVRHNTDEIYDKIFGALENYIMEVLPVKIELGDETAKEEYEQFLHTTVGKLDDNDRLMQKIVLLIKQKEIEHMRHSSISQMTIMKKFYQQRFIGTDQKNVKNIRNFGINTRQQKKMKKLNKY